MGRDSMIAGLQFHHIGVACRDLKKEMRAFAIVEHGPRREGAGAMGRAAEDCER